MLYSCLFVSVLHSISYWPIVAPASTQAEDGTVGNMISSRGEGMISNEGGVRKVVDVRTGSQVARLPMVGHALARIEYHLCHLLYRMLFSGLVWDMIFDVIDLLSRAS